MMIIRHLIFHAIYGDQEIQVRIDPIMILNG